MLMTSSLPVFAANLTPRQDDKGQWGYTDTSGKWVVKPKYTTAEPFSDGFAIVSKDGKYGVVDENGKEKVKCKHQILIVYDKGTFWAVESETSTTGKLYSLQESRTFNITGIQTIEATDSNRIMTGKNGSKKIGAFYNKYTHTIYTKGFSYYNAETKGLYTIYTLSFVDFYYNTTQQQYLGSGMQIPKDNIVRDEKGKFGIVPFVPCEYDHIAKANGNLGKFYCIKDNLKGMLKLSDTDYTMIIPCQYDSITDYTNTEYSAPYRNGKEGLYDIQGNMILPCEYDSIRANYSYSGYLFRYYKNNTMGIYSSFHGKTIVPAGIYDEYTGSLINNNLFMLEKDGTTALFSSITGKELVPTGKYVTYLAWRDNNYECVTGVDKNGRQALVKTDGKGTASKCIYKSMEKVHDSDGLYILTGLNNKHTLMDNDINIIVKDYDKILEFSQYAIIFQRNGRVGASYYNGKELVAPAYNDYAVGTKRIAFMKPTSTGFTMYVYDYDGTLFTTRTFRNSQMYEAEMFVLDYLHY